MGFLDNSGDIILDAVLTDTGRLRLARGDGSFRIAKFALGDDEIDYGKYDANNVSGSAYYDLQILKTPVFEAFTNNTSTMKSRLISISRTNLLYLPIIKLNTLNGDNATYTGLNTFLIMVDQDTQAQVAEDNAGSVPDGILAGHTLSTANNFIRTDQGIDNTALGGATAAIDADLKETQYIIEMDNRFGSVYSETGIAADVSFVDDDSIASYFLSQGTSTAFIADLPTDDANTQNILQAIAGPRGTKLFFKVKSSTNLGGSTYLFNTLGSTMTIGSTTYLTIDSTIRITGATTGYRIDVPVRYIKKQ